MTSETAEIAHGSAAAAARGTAGEAAPSLSDDRSWAHLDKMKLGRYGEYFAKMALVRAGFDVYSPEVDDKGIDLVLRVPGSPPRYLDVQVKTIRPTRSGYMFLRKKHFTIEPNRYLALVVLREGAEAMMFMVPASVWTDPQPPFSSRDYEGLKSEPEYGLTISPDALGSLEPFRFRGRGFEAAREPPTWTFLAQNLQIIWKGWSEKHSRTA